MRAKEDSLRTRPRALIQKLESDKNNLVSTSPSGRNPCWSKHKAINPRGSGGQVPQGYDKEALVRIIGGQQTFACR